MKNLNLWIALAFGVLLTIFALQNMAVIEVSFLNFDFQMRRVVLILASVGVGFLLGKATRLRRKEKHPIEKGDHQGE